MAYDTGAASAAPRDQDRDIGKPDDLLDWDGSLKPPPIEWEDREPWQDAKPEHHMQSWIRAIEDYGGKVDTGGNFTEGTTIVKDLELIQAPIHEESILDPAERHKHQHQTSHEVIMQQRIAILNRRIKARERERLNQEYAAEVLEPYVNPHAPKMEMYMRPGRLTDVQACAEIYRHYCKESLLVPEEANYEDKEMAEMVTYVNKSELPFIVAIRGVPDEGKPDRHNIPEHLDRKGSNRNIIGFGFAEEYGAGATYHHTAELQVYVHPANLRQGVGKTLMDRLMFFLDKGHSPLLGAPFVPCGCTWDIGGKRVISKVLCTIPYASGQPESVEGIRKFLEPWEFTEVGCLIEVGRKQGTW
jgi:L-amino acid N-acyltransferase YncA